MANVTEMAPFAAEVAFGPVPAHTLLRHRFDEPRVRIPPLEGGES